MAALAEEVGYASRASVATEGNLLKDLCVVMQGHATFKRGGECLMEKVGPGAFWGDLALVQGPRLCQVRDVGKLVVVVQSHLFSRSIHAHSLQTNPLKGLPGPNLQTYNATCRQFHVVGASLLVSHSCACRPQCSQRTGKSLGSTAPFRRSRVIHCPLHHRQTADRRWRALAWLVHRHLLVLRRALLLRVLPHRQFRAVRQT
jgi:hypothetical protein